MGVFRMDEVIVKNFELPRIYVGQVDGNCKFLYSVDRGSRYMVIPEYYQLNEQGVKVSYAEKLKYYKAANVKILCSLQELVEKEGIETILMNSHHQYLPTVSRSKIQQIKKIVANKKSKFASSLSKIQALADFTASVVCDELGLNVATHPMTTFVDVSKVQNVAVPATKVKRFKEELSKYVYVMLVLEQPEVIFQDRKERSSCLASCLEFSRIKSTPELVSNIVQVEPELRTGNVNIRRELLKPEYIQEQREVQKVHILSAK